jgi:hypothetical protein
VTWEAIEHGGPGVYDLDYLDYLEAVVAKAGEHNLRLFIDPHQDVWSRFSGGDGAPGWTLEAVGFKLENLHDTGAAFVHTMVGDNYPQMIWGTNTYKLAAATMFSLFFGGDFFAPKTVIDGVPVQEFLQSHYILAIQQVAARLKQFDHVIGYDSLNEPSSGWIGYRDIRHHNSMLQLEESPTPYQSMLLGDGIPTEVDVYSVRGLGVRKTNNRLLNPKGLRAWQEDTIGVWRENGVWDYGEDGKPQLLQPHYFQSINGRNVDFSNDLLKPFINRYGREIRNEDKKALIFIESVPSEDMPDWSQEDIDNVVDASHWYDDITLVTKRFRRFISLDIHNRKVVLGLRRIHDLFRRMLRKIKHTTRSKIGKVPTLIGEFGIPFDMHAKKAYRSGRYHKQVMALDASFQAIEANLLHATLWNYTPDNTNAHGDLWNDEDLSIFSRDQQDDPEDINSGARAPEAFIRPYPIATAGKPLALSFKIKNAIFRFRFRSDPAVSAPTVIYVPAYHYKDGIQIEVSDGKYDYQPEQQRLSFHPESTEGEHWIHFRTR